MVLRKLCKDDVPFMLEWMHDPNINCNFRFMASDYGVNEVSTFIEVAKKDFQDRRAYHFAKGVAIGTASHALGTSKAIEIGEVEGAMSGLSIGIAGILTVILAPVFAGLIP